MDNQQRSLAEDLAWFAGIIDGEGTLDVHLIKDGDRHRVCSVRLHVTNCETAIIGGCVQLFRRLSLPYYVSTTQHKGKDSWRPILRFRVEGYKRLLRVLPVIIPHLRSYKRQRAMLMLEICRSRAPKGQRIPWSEDEIKLGLAVRDCHPQELSETTMHALRCSEGIVQPA